MSVRYKKAREIALWVLYGLDIGGHDMGPDLEGWHPTIEELEPEAAGVWDHVDQRVEGVLEDLDEFDARIQEVSPRWRVDRMAVIDRNILRLGAWELFEADTPPLVIINACVELGKTYGEKNTPGFVNGLLDEICTRHGIEISPPS